MEKDGSDAEDDAYDALEGVSYVSTRANLTAVTEERVTDVKKGTSNLDENTSDAEDCDLEVVEGVSDGEDTFNVHDCVCDAN